MECSSSLHGGVRGKKEATHHRTYLQNMHSNSVFKKVYDIQVFSNNDEWYDDDDDDCKLTIRTSSPSPLPIILYAHTCICIYTCSVCVYVGAYISCAHTYICLYINMFLFFCFFWWNSCELDIRSNAPTLLMKCPPVSPPQVRGSPCSRFWTSTRTTSWTLMEPETPLWEVRGWKWSSAQLDSCVDFQLTFDTCKVCSLVVSPTFYMSVTFSPLLLTVWAYRGIKEKEKRKKRKLSLAVAVPAVPLPFSPAFINTWLTFETYLC